MTSSETLVNEESKNKPVPIQLYVIAGGGTIGSIVSDSGVRTAGGNRLNLVETLQMTHPEISRMIASVQTTSVFGGLSENMTRTIWTKFRSCLEDAIRSGQKTILITHGTDSLEQTAKYLNSIFQGSCLVNDVRVIITAANHDTQHPNTDAWQNLNFAIGSLHNVDTPAGIYVAFHDRLLPAATVVKAPHQPMSNGMDYLDEDSDEYLKLVKMRQESDRTIINQLQARFPSGQTTSNFVYHIMANTVDIDVNQWRNEIERNEPRVVIFTLYHSGTARSLSSLDIQREKYSPQDIDNTVDIFISRLTEQGIICFGVTENGEPVNLNGYETGVRLSNAGLIGLGELSEQVAIAKASLILSSNLNVSPEDLKSMMNN